MIEWFRRVAEQVHETDRDLVRRSASLPPSAADPALKRLTNAANRSVLWLTIAAVLSTRKGVTRRAALRGVAAIGGASATTNLVAKPLLPRRRPAAHLMPRRRRLSDPPTSSSFPSGHAASAIAFATAVTMESRLVGAVVIPLAIAVAYSRVHTGVHWPTDILCGAAVGGAIAWATKRWWPVRPEQPAEVREFVEQPSLVDGEQTLVLVNPEAGNGSSHRAEQIQAQWPAATVLSVNGSDDIVTTLDTALEEAEGSIQALGVAGGDGTVATAAAAASRHGLPLAVLPAGTLNHFARDVGVTTMDDVTKAVQKGTAVTVDIGDVGIDDRPGRWFLNTASLGGYPEMVRFREKWEPRWGKWLSAAAALSRVLYESKPLDVDIDGHPQRVWVLFVGNGTYAPRGFAPTWRPSMTSGTLDVRYVRADARFSRIRFVLAAITGTLHRSRTYVEREHESVLVTVSGDPVALATDGEVGPEGNRFHFRSTKHGLNVYRAEDA